MRNASNSANMKIKIMFDHYTHDQVRDVLMRRYNISVSDSGLRKNCRNRGLSKTEDLDPDLLLHLIYAITEDCRHVLGYRALRSIVRTMACASLKLPYALP